MSTVDLDAIRSKWLRVCGACDAGMFSGCVCPQEDPRPVMLRLVREVERLRARIAAHAGPHRRLIADRDEARAEVERLRAIVGDDDPRHIIEFRASGWTIGHPLSCRSDLFGCEVNRAAERDLVEAPEALGRFYCDIRDGRFVVTDIAARPTAEDGTRDG